MRPPNAPDVPVPRPPDLQQTTLPVAHRNGTLVDNHNRSRHASQPITCSLRLILIVIVAICLVLVGLLLIFLPPLLALSEAITVAIQTHQEIVSLAIVLAIVLIIVRLAQMPALLVRWLRNKAEHAALVRLQNDQPIHIQDMRRLDTESVLQMLLVAYDVQKTWAAHSAFHNLTTYGPSISYRTDQRPIALPLNDPQSAPQPLPFIEGKTRIEQLCDRGHICRSGNSLMVGYDAQTPVYIELQNASFVAVAGQPRVGKTSTVKYLLAQAAMMGWHIVLCDPHGHQEQGLLTVCQPISGSFIRQAIEPAEIIEAITFVDKIGRRRIAGDVSDKPVLLIIDEFTSLVLRKELPDDILARLTAMVVEYAKVKVHGVIIGHDWTGKLLGTSVGTPLRRAITHRVVHRSDMQNAEFLLPNAALARQVMGLEKGQVLYWGDYAPLVVSVPWIGGEDLRYAGSGQIPKPYAPRILAQQPSLSGPQTQPLPQPTVNEQIIALLQQRGCKLDFNEIAQTLGVDRQVVSNALTKLSRERRINREGPKRNYSYWL